MYGYFYKAGGEGLKGQEAVQKGGPGSGQKGHTGAFQPRKPYPGEEAHNLPPLGGTEDPNLAHSPEDLHPPHYSDSETMQKFRQLHAENPELVSGRFAYHKKDDKIVALNKEAKDLIAAAAKHKNNKNNAH